MVDARSLSQVYRRCHNHMRNLDGLQPQEAFDELLKYLFFRQYSEEQGESLDSQARLFEIHEGRVADSPIAARIRSLFEQYLAQVNSWSAYLWSDRRIHLSDAALLAVHEEFNGLQFKEVDLDIRSQALREFLTPEIRKGLGIFLTPESVVRMAIEIASPTPSQVVLDPACGSGTFLIEAVKFIQKSSDKRVSVFGIDKNPRMLLLAELNLGHLSSTSFQRRLSDSLNPGELFASQHPWPKPGSVDIIFTNPPFGVSVPISKTERDYYSSVEPGGRSQFPSEVLFLEQCLRLLRPGGTLAIVLPRSVLTNRTLAASRAAIGSLGYVKVAVSLPPETFGATGTQTATWVLFLRRYERSEKRDDLIEPVIAQITNVGYDATGRLRAGSQLDCLPAQIQACSSGHTAPSHIHRLAPTPKSETLSRLTMASAEAAPSNGPCSSLHLSDLVELAKTGRTPARAMYSDSGLFLVKVGNLTGSGINWEPRDRNFIEESLTRRIVLLKEGDILLTSSAHSVAYIGKKVDIVHRIPDEVGGKASFVGEVLLLRPRPDKVSPFALLAYLRMPSTTIAIQRMVSGQTAHLMPDDLLTLPVPDWVTAPNAELERAIDLLRRECELSSELSTIGFQQRRLYTAIGQNGL